MATAVLQSTSLRYSAGLVNQRKVNESNRTRNPSIPSTTSYPPSSVSLVNMNGRQIKDSKNKTRRISPMMCSLRDNTSSSMSSFFGLRVADALYTMISDQTSLDILQSKVQRAGSDRQGRKSRVGPLLASLEFDDQCLEVVHLADEESRCLGQYCVGSGHILLGLIREGTGIAAKVLMSMGIRLKDARVELEKIEGRGSGFHATEIMFTPDVKCILEISRDEALYLGDSCISTGHLLLGLLREVESIASKVLESLGVELSHITTLVITMMADKRDNVTAGSWGGSSESKTPAPTPLLNEYGTNLTKLAAEGKLDPVVGREVQIKRVIQILGRRTKHNPCLVGEPGVGKTAVVEGLAQIIVSGDCPKTIQGKQVISLDIGRLVAGTKYRGEFEERMKDLMAELEQSDEIILFIDEVHTLLKAGGAEGAIDAANILKPALARGKLKCIGATTLNEYRTHIEKDPALERRFQPVDVPEPTVDETIQILKGLRERYEIHHQLSYSNEALDAAAQLSSQYISDRFLPDKAIDLIDEAGSMVSLHHAQSPLSKEARELENDLRQITEQLNEAGRSQDFEKVRKLSDKGIDLKARLSALIDKNKETNSPESKTGITVTAADIQHVVALRTSIPVDNVSTDESTRLVNMEETLHKRVIGQDEAVKAISRAVRRSRAGLKNPNRPIASFIFSGPTGVGKSELANAIATYFGSEAYMIRLDMSEFMEKHTVSKLFGTPPGYVGYEDGGQLTEVVRRHPYTVVLFDEIEKAHPDVFNVMLQILDDGRLTDGKGRTVDFKNTIIIMTSNIGSSLIEKGGRNRGFELDYDDNVSSYDRIKDLVLEEHTKYFKPEFLNRVDEMIVFRQLTKGEVKEIAYIMLKEVVERLKAKGIDLRLTEGFMNKVADEGFDPKYGARPLRRAITKLLEDSITEKILSREIKEGDMVVFDVDFDGNIIVSK